MSTTENLSSSIDTWAAACGVLVATGGSAGTAGTAGTFEHLATCWSMAPGEWVTVLADEETVPQADWRLILAADGSIHPLSDWEIDGVVAGCKSATAPRTLAVADEGQLRKRQALTAFGYPSVIDHPAVALHRGSLDAERYYPYFCPWQVEGHLALLGAHTSFLAGATFAGMRGGPVLDQSGRVVGSLGLPPAAGAVPLTPFWRFC